MAAPHSTSTSGPVVAILDTGLGEHPWFGPGSNVERDPRIHGEPIGLRFPPEDDPEGSGVTLDHLNRSLDPLAGHGTFIAGIIRQRCPDSRLVIVPVMYGDGAADEMDLIDALQKLLMRQWARLDGGDKGEPLDVVSLSLGYYHETPQSVERESALFALIRALGEAGVSVVAAAGNGATTQPFWPAALADVPGRGVPVVSVGASNPPGAAVSLFSNTGPWVSCYRPGVAVVSTMPTTFDSSLRGSVFVPRGNQSRPRHL